MEQVTLGQKLASLTTNGTLYEKLSGDKTRCVACSHRCTILPGKAGICRVRFNERGSLRVPHGYVGALQVDPIEKKPFFHALPATRALSFGMLGCDFHCAYCQNWVTSQTLRDPKAGGQPEPITANELVRLAKDEGAGVITSTYNEPLITAEWAVGVFQRAKAEGLTTAFVSNGNGTREVIEYLAPWIDLYKIDLKSFQDKAYRELGGRLQPVLDTIKHLHALGIWIEIVTLLVPAFNDTDQELKQIAAFIASVSSEIPWHVTAFHRDYKMTKNDPTEAKSLRRAVALGKQAGLNYVYAGNLPGLVGQAENTYCPKCQTLLIERLGFKVLQTRLSKGACPTCQTPISGYWK